MCIQITAARLVGVNRIAPRSERGRYHIDVRIQVRNIYLYTCVRVRVCAVAVAVSEVFARRVVFVFITSVLIGVLVAYPFCHNRAGLE